MKKQIFVFVSALFMVGFSNVAFAEQIDNLQAILTSDGKDLYVSWDSASSEALVTSDGYAVQWSDRQSDVQVDKVGRKFLETSETSFSVASWSFEKNEYYYFRVYTYKKEGSSYSNAILGNGSKILKIRINSDDSLDTSYIEPNDPVIVDNGNSEIENFEEFGHVRVLEYDNFADFYWSRPRKLVSSDYDGFHILVSKDNDMSNPVTILETSRSTFEGRVKGLSPETVYYAQGFFYKDRAGEDQRFGSGEKKQFRTSRVIKRNVGREGTRLDQKMSRNIAKVERRAIISVIAGGASESSSSTTSENTTTSSSPSSTTTTNTETSSSQTNSTISGLPYSEMAIDKLNTEKEIKARIDDLERDIKKMEEELVAWQKKLRNLKSPYGSSRSYTRRTRTTSSSSVRSSTRSTIRRYGSNPYQKGSAHGSYKR